jgi:formyltetrahydrofolate deformylase
VAAYILNLACADRPGIVATVAKAVFDCGGNITENHQFSDEHSALFCMRTRFETDLEDAGEIERMLNERAAAIGADAITVRAEDARPRVLILVSRFDHCLTDLLQRWRAGELAADIRAVVSNHPDLEHVAHGFGVPFEHVPVTEETKPAAEARLLEVIEREQVDLVVLARYMQILSDDLCRRLSGRAINIHHSFLPGFKGARPYHQAWDRGVKIIGATAHYVTGVLDEGPIIDQDVVRVTHADTVERMVVAGRDIERIVLSRAVKAHVEGRVFLLGQRTVVFT